MIVERCSFTPLIAAVGSRLFDRWLSALLLSAFLAESATLLMTLDAVRAAAKELEVTVRFYTK